MADRRAREAEEAQRKAEEDKKAAAQREFEAKRDSAVQELKGVSTQESGLKGVEEDAPSLKSAEDAHGASDRHTHQSMVANSIRRTIDCAMAEVYKAAETLGPQGKDFAQGLLRQISQAEDSLPQPAPDGAPDTYGIVDVSRNSMSEGIRGDRQLVVRTLVSRETQTGRTHVDVMYSLSRAGQEVSSGQDVVLLGPSGAVECQQVTPASARCMGESSPRAATADFCAKPPPGRSGKSP